MDGELGVVNRLHIVVTNFGGLATGVVFVIRIFVWDTLDLGASVFSPFELR